ARSSCRSGAFNRGMAAASWTSRPLPRLPSHLSAEHHAPALARGIARPVAGADARLRGGGISSVDPPVLRNRDTNSERNGDCAGLLGVAIPAVGRQRCRRATAALARSKGVAPALGRRDGIQASP